MKFLKQAALFWVPIVILSACGATSNGSLRPEGSFFSQPIEVSAAEVTSWRTNAVRVQFAPNLRVSTNPNVQFPSEEIVWWGEPNGDRFKQVGAIMAAGIRRGTVGLAGPKPVDFEVTVNLFHAVTPRARNGSRFAWHDVSYSLRVLDSRTGQVLAIAPKIDADLEALRGETARQAESQGQTQKVRIQSQVALSINTWLNSSGAKIGLTPPRPVAAAPTRRRAATPAPSEATTTPDPAATPAEEPEAVGPDPEPVTPVEVPVEPEPAPEPEPDDVALRY